MPLATACSCGKVFTSTRGLKIHQSRWCEVGKQRELHREQNKSINGIQSQDIHHSAQEPTASQPQDLESEPSNERLKWPAGNALTEWSSLDDELNEILKERLAKCNTRDVEGRLSVLTTVVYDKCKEKLGVIEINHRRL